MIRKSLTWLTDEAPQTKNQLIAAVVFEAEHAHTGGLAEEHPPPSWRKAEPAGRNHTDDVAAGESQHIARDAVYPSEKAVRAGGNVSRRFPVWTAIAVELPAGPLLQDVACQLPLEAAVVPLDQVVIDFRASPEAGQLTGLRGPQQRTGENAAEGKLPQPPAQLPCMLLPPFIQRQVGSTRVLVGVGLGRVAVPGEIELWQVR